MNTAILQVTECPDDIRLLSRMATISEQGVVLGGSIECDLILPSVDDEQGDAEQLVKVLVDKATGQYKLVALIEGVKINGRAQLANSSALLSDGDVITFHGYTLLFSNENEQQVNVVAEGQSADSFFESVDDIAFDASNIFADLESELDQALSEHNTERQSDDFIEMAQELKVEAAISTDSNQRAIEQKLDQLLAVTQNPWQQQKQLLMMMDDVVDEFIKEFDPQLIDEMVGAPSMLSSKHWNAYKSYYERKIKEGHFKRQFKALLIECMQK
ncbi:hypothetical protein CWB96_04035 [Pseudoalteromonas citrea]|uniref:FHA domain-containing protein n=1 Tax=Pseudoalteromonas citrea TaxID=43655 RepID=A0A5S3XSZ5_9GAMM|nr:hypothetical protein [Pseudoalteromonas citrea]TMP45157.1 hypothetical protein CWB97_04975 [Pseudoalteromonas citrea]TMP61462.1 hypothetical protein CWB96_04035 [Pseudoalteromonas citrea]